jgi:hypothetical protein
LILKSTIFRHIKNIFSEGELMRGSVVANFATTAADGKAYFENAPQEAVKAFEKVKNGRGSKISKYHQMVHFR